MPFARNAATMPVRTSPLPAVASAGVPSEQTQTPSPGLATSVSAPFSTQTQPKRSAARRAASSRCAETQLDSSPSSRAELALVRGQHGRRLRSNGSSSKSPSASTTTGTSSSASSRRTTSFGPVPAPQAGTERDRARLSGELGDRLDRARRDPSTVLGHGSLTASRSRCSKTGSVESGTATAT